MAESEHRFASYEEFWPYYLRQHSKPETRMIHFIGILLAAISALKGLFTLKLGWILAAPVIGYVCAWGAHVFIELNQPVTFEYPLWSLQADIYMLRLWVTGELDRELERNEIRSGSIKGQQGKE